MGLATNGCVVVERDTDAGRTFGCGGFEEVCMIAPAAGDLGDDDAVDGDDVDMAAAAV